MDSECGIRRLRGLADRMQHPIMTRTALTLAIILLGCGDSEGDDGKTGGAGGGGSPGGTGGVGGVSSEGGAGGGEAIGGGPTVQPEEQPPVAEGNGVSDPLSRSLHNHACGGTDWQRVHGWLLLPHAAPEIGPADEMARCVERYAGWVTNEADAAEVSRASVYAALAASGQCDAAGDYHGADLLAGSACIAAHPDLTESECLDRMAELRSFGISTVAQSIAAAAEQHDSDIPLMGAYVARGAVGCGGKDRWRLDAPEGFVDRYVTAYNAYKALSTEAPTCSKRIVVTVALYTGMDDPGADGVTAANGCWTYERVSKQNAEWKICNYDGTVTHENGVKWAFDDTSTQHTASGDQTGINNCMEDVPGRGYVYMTNRGSGWPKRVTEGVEVHFAEIYSGQFTVDDQYSAWVDGGTPGQPLVNFGEPTTSAATIRQSTRRTCNKVQDGGYLGVYVYPESLRGGRMSAMVEELNDCTAQ